MKKIILIGALLVIMLIALTGCTNTIEAGTEERFVIIQDWRDNTLVYDKETRVQYYIINTYQGVGITVLVDADGKPLLYEGE